MKKKITAVFMLLVLAFSLIAFSGCTFFEEKAREQKFINYAFDRLEDRNFYGRLVTASSGISMEFYLDGNKAKIVSKTEVVYVEWDKKANKAYVYTRSNGEWIVNEMAYNETFWLGGNNNSLINIDLAPLFEKKNYIATEEPWVYKLKERVIERNPALSQATLTYQISPQSDIYKDNYPHSIELDDLAVLIRIPIGFGGGQISSYFMFYDFGNISVELPLAKQI